MLQGMTKWAKRQPKGEGFYWIRGLSDEGRSLDDLVAYRDERGTWCFVNGDECAVLPKGIFYSKVEAPE